MRKIIASSMINQYPEVDFIIQQLSDNSLNYNFSDETSLYFGFPKFVGYEENGIEPDLLILSPLHGILVIRFYKNDASEEKIEEVTEELYSLLFSKLSESKRLRVTRREIKIPIEAYVYIENSSIDSEFIVSSVEAIGEKLDQQSLMKKSKKIFFMRRDL